MKTHTPCLWDWPAAALSVLLTYVAAARLSITAWAAGLWMVELLAVLGSVLGLALGFSQFQHSSLRWLWVIMFVVLDWGATVGIGRLERRYSFSQRIPRTIEAVYLRAHRQPPRWLWCWIRWSEAAPVERAFHAINQALTWLDSPPPPHATPQERAALLERLLPEAAGDIRLLTVAHERTLYAARAWPPAEAHCAAWRLRFQAARASMRRRFTHGEQA